jgi:methionyl-tRNA formyltransferase
VAWTILLQRQAAANLFFLTDEADAGDIIEQRPVEVLPDDYSEDLIRRTNVVLEQMVADLSPAFASGKVLRRPQDHSKATYYKRRRPEDGLIDWRRPADEIYRLIRAAGRPYPGAFTFCDGRKVIIWRAKPVEGSKAKAAPGEVVAESPDGSTVQAGDRLLQLTDIQFVDDPGARLAVGQRLG